MGIGAAAIFPSTLSLIANVFTERAERARGHRPVGRDHRRRRGHRPDRRRLAPRALLVGQRVPLHGAGRRARRAATAALRCRPPRTRPPRRPTGRAWRCRASRWARSSSGSSRPPTGAGAPARTLATLALGLALLDPVRRRRAPHARPDAGRAPVPQPPLLRRQRLDRHRLLHARRLHLPRSPSTSSSCRTTRRSATGLRLLPGGDLDRGRLGGRHQARRPHRQQGGRGHRACRMGHRAAVDLAATARRRT